MSNFVLPAFNKQKKLDRFLQQVEEHKVKLQINKRGIERRMQ